MRTTEARVFDNIFAIRKQELRKLEPNDLQFAFDFQSWAGAS